MVEIVNLKRVRKQRDRADAAAKAAAARARHGRDKAAKLNEAQAAARQKATLEHHRIRWDRLTDKDAREYKDLERGGASISADHALHVKRREP